MIIKAHLTKLGTGLGVVLLSFGLCSAQKPAASKGAKMASMPFSKVAPLIKEQCMGCHNDQRHPESINLSTYATLMKSGEHGSIVVAGHPEKSKLILYVNGSKNPRMPFKKKPLTAAQISLLSQWIKAGAKA